MDAQKIDPRSAGRDSRSKLPGSGESTSTNQPTQNGSICYVFGVLFPILYLPLSSRNRNHFLRFHCFQSLLLMSIWAPLLLKVTRTNWILSAISLLFLIAWIVSMVKAGRGMMYRLPLIGAVAARIEKL
jgi:uncharacterized membrane protein